MLRAIDYNHKIEQVYSKYHKFLYYFNEEEINYLEKQNRACSTKVKWKEFF